MLKFISLLALCIHITCSIGIDKQKKVMLLGFDGLEYTTFERLLMNGELPNFSRFKFQKCFSGGIVNTPAEQPTKSGPSWMTILSGTYMNKHHIGSNEDKDVNDEYKSIFRLIKEQKPEAQVYSFTAWGQLNKNLLQRDSDIITKMKSKNKDNDLYPYILETLEKEEVDFLFAQFDNADDESHKYGYSREYTNQIKNQDRILGQIWKQMLKRQSQYPNEDWLILIVTDHGRDLEGFQHGEFYPQLYSEKLAFIGTNKDIMNAEFNSPLKPSISDYNNIYQYISQVSITPTILKYLGVSYDKNSLQFDGIPLIGKMGVRKLMQKGNKMVWSIEDQTEQVQETITIEADGVYIETIDAQQGVWPQSEQGKLAWENNTDFSFTKNNISITYRKSQFYLQVPQLKPKTPKTIIITLSALLFISITIIIIMFAMIYRYKKMKQLRRQQQYNNENANDKDLESYVEDIQDQVMKNLDSKQYQFQQVQNVEDSNQEQSPKEIMHDIEIRNN